MPTRTVELFGGRTVDLADSLNACTICGATVAPSLMGYHLGWHDPEQGRIWDSIHAVITEPGEDA